jgi:hypothetical protein
VIHIENPQVIGAFAAALGISILSQMPIFSLSVNAAETRVSPIFARPDRTDARPISTRGDGAAKQIVYWVWYDSGDPFPGPHLDPVTGQPAPWLDISNAGTGGSFVSPGFVQQGPSRNYAGCYYTLAQATAVAEMLSVHSSYHVETGTYPCSNKLAS